MNQTVTLNRWLAVVLCLGMARALLHSTAIDAVDVEHAWTFVGVWSIVSFLFGVVMTIYFVLLALALTWQGLRKRKATDEHAS